MHIVDNIVCLIRETLRLKMHTKYEFLPLLEITASYAGLLLVPAEGFGRGFFCPSGKKRAYYAVLAHFWQFLVSSSNISNFEKKTKKPKKSKKNIKKSKKFQKIQKIKKV